jgi:hypothetical protein
MYASKPGMASLSISSFPSSGGQEKQKILGVSVLDMSETQTIIFVTLF